MDPDSETGRHVWSRRGTVGAWDEVEPCTPPSLDDLDCDVTRQSSLQAHTTPPPTFLTDMMLGKDGNLALPKPTYRGLTRYSSCVSPSISIHVEGRYLLVYCVRKTINSALVEPLMMAFCVRFTPEDEFNSLFAFAFKKDTQHRHTVNDDTYSFTV